MLGRVNLQVLPRDQLLEEQAFEHLHMHLFAHIQQFGDESQLLVLTIASHAGEHLVSLIEQCVLDLVPLFLLSVIGRYRLLVVLNSHDLFGCAGQPANIPLQSLVQHFKIIPLAVTAAATTNIVDVLVAKRLHHLHLPLQLAV